MAYKTRHDSVGKVIHWQLCKKLKFDYTTKWYMHKPEFILQNETHKTFWGFYIQTGHLIPVRRTDLMKSKKKRKRKKKTCWRVDFAVKIKES